MFLCVTCWISKEQKADCSKTFQIPHVQSFDKKWAQKD